MPTEPSKYVLSPSGPYSAIASLNLASNSPLTACPSRFQMPACTLMGCFSLAAFQNPVDPVYISPLVDGVAIDLGPRVRLKGQFLRSYDHLSGHP